MSRPPARLGGAAEVQANGITTSTRDPQELGKRLALWLGTGGAKRTNVQVTNVLTPEGNGMSSETILFDASWVQDGVGNSRSCVARIAPEMENLPIFGQYDLGQQFDAMTLVRDATSVPMPEALWYEPDPSIVGSAFFVMERVDGEIPRDVLPYTFGDNWVDSASTQQRQRLQRSAIRSLAQIHTVTSSTHDLSAFQYDISGATALERHISKWEAYNDWVAGEHRSALLDDCFGWLRDNIPTQTLPDALSWGDSRIGNMIFSDFEVAAVLDWEMVGVAPPEVDLGWMIYMHQFFQDIATDLGLVGLPDFMVPAEMISLYEDFSATSVEDLRWYLAYAAMRHGVIMRRVTQRAVLFGEAIEPPDLDDMIIHRATLEAMLDGSYWATIDL